MTSFAVLTRTAVSATHEAWFLIYRNRLDQAYFVLAAVLVAL